MSQPAELMCQCVTSAVPVLKCEVAGQAPTLLTDTVNYIRGERWKAGDSSNLKLQDQSKADFYQHSPFSKRRN